MRRPTILAIAAGLQAMAGAMGISAPADALAIRKQDQAPPMVLLGGGTSNGAYNTPKISGRSWVAKDKRAARKTRNRLRARGQHRKAVR